MCLGMPGQIESIETESQLGKDFSEEGSLDWMRTGVVRFSGVARRVNLSLVPEAAVGDYVLVHVGVALSVLQEKEALENLAYLAKLSESP